MPGPGDGMKLMCPVKCRVGVSMVNSAMRPRAQHLRRWPERGWRDPEWGRTMAAGRSCRDKEAPELQLSRKGAVQVEGQGQSCGKCRVGVEHTNWTPRSKPNVDKKTVARNTPK